MNKIGRNDPCPCGSGKKFKKCCEFKAGPKKIQAELTPPSSAGKVASLFSRATRKEDHPDRPL